MVCVTPDAGRRGWRAPGRRMPDAAGLDRARGSHLTTALRVYVDRVVQPGNPTPSTHTCGGAGGPGRRGGWDGGIYRTVGRGDR